MDRTDPDYAAFLDRLPELRRVYDPRLHQFEVTNGPGHGDSLGSVERYFAQVGFVREANRQTLRRLVAFVNHIRAGMSREDAVNQAWRGFPDPRYGIPRDLGAQSIAPQRLSRSQRRRSSTQSLDEMTADAVARVGITLSVLFTVGCWFVAILVLFTDEPIAIKVLILAGTLGLTWATRWYVVGTVRRRDWADNGIARWDDD